MILLADGGATKTDWCLLKENGETVFIDSEGYNPYFVNAEYIRDSIGKRFKDIGNKEQIEEVHYYGSGCFPGPASIVREGISQVFKQAKVYVELDLLAAARAVLGTKPGFTAILGTGTNTCIYNGKEIIQNIDSLGYILGDEGSGTALGKKFLAAYIRDHMPAEIHELFYGQYKLDKEKIFEKVYSSTFPNRFCAGFATFIHQYLHLDYISGLVDNCFRELFTNLVCRYERYQDYSFNCIGSIGFQFSEHLRKIAYEFNMQPGLILKSPIEGLIDYHRVTKNVNNA